MESALGPISQQQRKIQKKRELALGKTKQSLQRAVGTLAEKFHYWAKTAHETPKKSHVKAGTKFAPPLLLYFPSKLIFCTDKEPYLNLSEMYTETKYVHPCGAHFIFPKN